MTVRSRVWLFLLAASTGAALAGEPVLFEDFEGSDYGAWVAAGTAFGTRPAEGTLAGQNPVSGFSGKGLVPAAFAVHPAAAQAPLYGYGVGVAVALGFAAFSLAVRYLNVYPEAA